MSQRVRVIADAVRLATEDAELGRHFTSWIGYTYRAPTRASRAVLDAHMANARSELHDYYLILWAVDQRARRAAAFSR